MGIALLCTAMLRCCFLLSNRTGVYRQVDSCSHTGDNSRIPARLPRRVDKQHLVRTVKILSRFRHEIVRGLIVVVVAMFGTYMLNQSRAFHAFEHLILSLEENIRENVR